MHGTDHERVDSQSRDELIAEVKELRHRLALTEGQASAATASDILRHALDNVPALVSFVDSDRRFRFANGTYEDWLGILPADVVGRTTRDVLGADADERLSEVLGRVRGGEAVSFRSALTFRDGSRREMEVKLVPHFARDGTYLGYFALVLDVTEEVGAQRALQDSEARYRSLLEFNPDAVYVHCDFQIMYMNPAASRMFGANYPGEFVGRSFFEFADPSDHAVMRQRYIDTLANRAQPPREFVLRRLDGTAVELRAALEPVTWEGERGVLVVSQDITGEKRIERELETARVAAEEARNRLIDAVENIPEAFAIFTADERIEFFNSNYIEKIWPQSRDLLTPGASLEEVVREAARRSLDRDGDGPSPEVDRFVVDAMHRHRSAPSTTELRRPDGRWLRIAKRRTPDGRIVGVYSDITEAKRREVDLAESEERYRRVVEDSPDAILVSCGDAVVYANEAAVRLFGARSKSDLIGRELADLRAPGEEGLPEIRTERLRSSRSAGTEYQKRRRLDGSLVDVDVSSVRILWYGREALLTTMRDVSPRIRAQTALEEAERRLSVAARNFPGAIYQRLLRPDGTITFPYVSSGIAGILGIEADEIVPNPRLLMDLVPKERRAALREAIEESARWMAPFEMEIPVLARTGEIVWLRSVARPRELEDGSIIWDGVWLDITERNLARQALQAAKDEAEAANEAKSRFLANVSHELRTPLNAVIGYAEVIRDRILGDDAGDRYRQYAADIHASGMHLLSLIDDILDLSKIEAGKQALEETDVPVDRLLDETLRIASPAVLRSSANLRVEVAPDMPLLRVDERKFRQVLINLLSNAYKFSPDGADVVLSASVLPDRSIRFSIRDFGPGIAPADIEKILVPFGQIPHSRRGGQTGTGLGLPLSKGLVEVHGGSFSIESEVGVGTEVVIVLPETRGVWQESFAFGKG
jgi:PAS domain S-box-containing protein